MNEIAAMHGVTGALAVLLAFQNLFEDQRSFLSLSEIAVDNEKNCVQVLNFKILDDFSI